MTERDPFTGRKPRSFSRLSLATSQMSGVVCAVNWPRGCSLCGLPIIMSINPGTGNEIWCRNGLRDLCWEFGPVHWPWDWGGQHGITSHSAKWRFLEKNLSSSSSEQDITKKWQFNGISFSIEKKHLEKVIFPQSPPYSWVIEDSSVSLCGTGASFPAGIKFQWEEPIFWCSWHAEMLARGAEREKTRNKSEENIVSVREGFPAESRRVGPYLTHQWLFNWNPTSKKYKTQQKSAAKKQPQILHHPY